MIEYYTEGCNSFKKEPEIFSIRQTFFMLLLCLLGSTLVLYLVVDSIGLRVGKYLVAAGVPLLLLLYAGIRTAGDRLTLGYLFKRLAYPRVPKYLKGSSVTLTTYNNAENI
jgi:hypothetical protein